MTESGDSQIRWIAYLSETSAQTVDVAFSTTQAQVSAVVRVEAGGGGSGGRGL